MRDGRRGEREGETVRKGRRRTHDTTAPIFVGV